MNWKYFKRYEFACKCGCGKNLIENEIIDALDELRTLHGSPLIITSGYRCPEHNQKVSSTGPDGPHTTGLAADIAVNREEAVRLLTWALDTVMFKFTGIGLNQKGENRFLHLDLIARPTRTIWTY